MFSMVKVYFAIAGATLVLAAALPASATDPLSLLTTGNEVLVDTSGDILVPGTGYSNSADALAGNGNFSPTGTWIGKGSVLVSSFAINTITTAQDTTTIGSGTAYNELNGLVALDCAGASVNASGSWSSTFGSVVGSATATAAIAAMSASAGTAVATWAPNTLMSFYDGSPLPYSKTGGTSAAVLNSDLTTATSGLEIWDLGIGTAGTGWNSVDISNNIGQVGQVPSPLNGGTVDFSLDLTAAAPGFSQYLAPPGVQSTVGTPGQLVNMAGSANLLGTAGQSTPFNAYDNSDFAISTSVPEPASLFLCLAAFLIDGLALAKQRVRRADGAPSTFRRSKSHGSDSGLSSPAGPY